MVRWRINPSKDYLGKLITSHMEELWVNQWKGTSLSRQSRLLIGKPGKTAIKRIIKLPKKELRLLVGITTGHSTLNKHLSKMLRRDDPSCDQCGKAEETSEHFLFECPAFRIQRAKNSISRGWKLETKQSISNLIKYIKSTGRFQ